MRGETLSQNTNLEEALNISTASLSASDRKIVRSNQMDQKINLAAGIYTPKRDILAASG